MKIFLVVLKIDNGVTFETLKFLVRAETKLDAIGIAAAAYDKFAGYKDSIWVPPYNIDGEEWLILSYSCEEVDDES